MKIFKITVENFRLLKDLSIDLEEELSLIIGKNNTGKTSILVVLEKFLNQSDKNRFLFDDFNIEYKKYLESLVESPTVISEENYISTGVKLKLFIQYGSSDNLSNISRIMMDLDPDNNVVVLGYEYILDYLGYIKIRLAYSEYKAKQTDKKQKDENYNPKGISDFLKLAQGDYFVVRKKSFEYDLHNSKVNENVYIILEDEKINVKNIINFKFISARRDVTNKEVDKTLSGQTSRIYEKTEATEERNRAVDDFKEKLSETDDHLSDIYKSMFNEIVEKVKIFGGVKINESDIEIISTLQHKELLKGNTTVVYRQDEGHQLPEHYNGLGYMNLISMIFEIEILVQEFKRETDKVPADINLLFIEEPEAHTHPQMQYVFIKNIKKLLAEGIVRKDGIKRRLQYIISTHSSHIVADSDFNDIKYLKRRSMNGVVAKSLKKLEAEYTANGQEQNFRFLKQYLTLHRAELFFADKAIFVEGDTERILLPAMMKKIDKERPENPLLSQNISVIEVGNYANIFERFINFIEVKSLVITDIDSVKKDFIKNGDGTIKTSSNGKQRKADFACLVSEGERTSNPTLNFFFENIPFNELRVKNLDQKRFKKETNWSVHTDGFLQIVFQTEENSYHARSFEDAFFNIAKNIDFIKTNRSKFKGLKNVKYFYDITKSPFDLAENCIDSKGTFAIDILMFSANDFDNWQIPAYIKEGLLWLKQD
jgi:predicted ATP-dependent endonuclease of OLD family